MKIIGHTGGQGFIVELSSVEMDALFVRRYENPDVGTEVDVITRLRPTMKFEESASAGPHMVARLREMADELEKGLAALRSANG